MLEYWPYTLASCRNFVNFVDAYVLLNTCEYCFGKIKELLTGT